MACSGTVRRLRLLPVAVAAVLGAAIWYAPATVGDCAPNHRDYSVREEVGHAATGRLARSIVRAMLAKVRRREVGSKASPLASVDMRMGRP